MHVLKCTILQDKLGLTSEDHDGYGSSFVAVWDRPDVPDQNDEQAVKAWNDYLEDLEELDRCYLLSMMSKENRQRLDIPDAILLAQVVTTLDEVSTSVKLSKISRVAPNYRGEVGVHKWNTWALEIIGERGQTQERLIFRGKRPRDLKGHKDHRKDQRLHQVELGKTLKRARQTL